MRLRILTAIILIPILAAGFWPCSTTRASSPSYPYLVVIVMDGFRADYLKLAPMRHLRALMSRGMFYDGAWVGQIESETPTGHATIATGVYPRKHGVIGFGWRDPRTGLFTFIPTNLGQIEQGQLSQTIEQGGVPSISDLVHTRNKSDIAISASGEKLWASAPLGTGADYVLYGREVPVKPGQPKFRPLAVGPNIPAPSTGYQSVMATDSSFDLQDSFAARLAVKLVASLRPRVLLLNLPAPDIAGHYYGGPADPTDMATTIKGTDWAIGQVMKEYTKLGLINKTVFVVTADHGMVTGRQRIPGHNIKQAIVHSSASLLTLQLHNSVGSVWLHDPEHAGPLAETLATSKFTGIEGALYKVPDGTGWKFAATPSTAAKLPPAVLRAYLDLADTEASPNGADILLPYAENTTGLPVTHKFKGMHGGFSWGAQHIPIIIAGPGVRHGVSHFPAKLVDIAPTIERLIDLPIPSGVDGVVLADSLTQPTAAEHDTQAVVQQGRAADVRALESHSALQIKQGQ